MKMGVRGMFFMWVIMIVVAWVCALVSGSGYGQLMRLMHIDSDQI